MGWEFADEVFKIIEFHYEEAYYEDEVGRQGLWGEGCRLLYVYEWEEGFLLGEELEELEDWEEEVYGSDELYGDVEGEYGG